MTDYAAFARKHVRDIYDRQWKSGRLPQIAPFANEDWFMWVMNGSVGWACAGVYIPLYMYRKYGDRRILEENYEGMLRYADFMISRAGKWGGPYAKPVRLSRKNRKYFVNCGQSYDSPTASGRNPKTCAPSNGTTLPLLIPRNPPPTPTSLCTACWKWRTSWENPATRV